MDFGRRIFNLIVNTTFTLLTLQLALIDCDLFFFFFFHLIERTLTVTYSP